MTNSAYLRRLGAVLLCLFAMTLGVPSATAQEATQLKLRMASIPFGFHAGLFLAIERGWIKAGGVDLVVEDGTGSTATVGLLGSGQYDIGEAAVSSMATARDKGMPLKAIAVFIRETDLGVLVPKGSGIKSPKDLEGKKLAYTSGSLEGPFMEPFFKSGGADMSKVEMLNVDIPSKVNLYLAGKADAVVTTVPFVLPMAATRRASDTIMFGDFGFVLPSIGYIATDKTIKEKSRALQVFVTAITRAWQEILDNNKIDDGIAALVKNRPQAKIDTVVAKGQIEAYRSFFYTKNTKGRPLGWQSPEDWAAAIASMQKVGLIRVGANVQDFYTNEFYPR